MHPSEPNPSLPDVDERLVAPETRFEIEDGRVVYVSPAHEPHGSAHAKLAAVIDAHRGPDFAVAVDMLTRTSRIDDIAPDVSVYPAARNPQTGGRQLEHLAFEIASTESLGHAGSRAAKLVSRGVRRVFAIDVARGRAHEWSSQLDVWSVLDPRSQIVDSAFAVALPVDALLDAARADAAIPRAYRVQRHPEFARTSLPMSTDQIYRLEYTPGVDAQIESALRWWVKHRDKAPGLLVREIERALALIAATPEIGQRAKTSQFGRLHRKRKSDHCYRCERCTGAQVHQVEICGALA